LGHPSTDVCILHPSTHDQIHVELATTKKRDLSVADYFRKIKNLATDLAATDTPLNDDEVIAYLLAGLDSTYDPFVTSMTTKSEPLSLDDVFTYLMVFEAPQIYHSQNYNSFF
jgi:hypothetical protein